MAEIAGLTLITPSSVAGSGVSLSGAKVVFTAATSVSVNGVFDSTYDNYLVVSRHVSTASQYDLNCRWRASGSDASGTDYTRQSLSVGDTSVGGGRTTSATSAVLGCTASTQRSGDHCYIYGPALAQPTASRTVNVRGFSDAAIVDFACTHSLSTSYDGFTIFPNSSSITGALTVYGLSQ